MMWHMDSPHCSVCAAPMVLWPEDGRCDLCRERDMEALSLAVGPAGVRCASAVTATESRPRARRRSTAHPTLPGLDRIGH